MTSREQIEDTIKRVYAHRTAGNHEACIAEFHEDARLTWAGSPSHCPLSIEARGRAEIHSVIRQIIDNFEVIRLKHESVLVDGEQAAVLTTARFRHTPSGEVVDTQLFDLWTFHDGKVLSLQQFGDTALVATLARSTAQAMAPR